MSDQDLDAARYFVADVADAAGVSAITLQNWIKRGAIEFSKHDRESKGSGSRHLFTMRTALRIAVTAELVRHHITPQEANEIAGVVTELVGKRNLAIKHEGKVVPVQGAEAGHYLIITPGKPDINEVFGTSRLALEKLFSDPNAISLIVFELTRIEARTRDRLAARH